MDQLQQVRKSSWFKRNTGATVALIAVTACAFLLFFGICIFVWVLAVLGSSAPAKLAIARSKSNPAVVQYLGQPIRVGFLVSGSVNTSGPSGHAELSIPISGPRGKGTIFLIANKKLGSWSFSALEFAPQDGAERINLLQSRSGTPVRQSQ